MGKFSSGEFLAYDEIHRVDRQDVAQHRAHAIRLYDVVLHNGERRLIGADDILRHGWLWRSKLGDYYSLVERKRKNETDNWPNCAFCSEKARRIW